MLDWSIKTWHRRLVQWTYGDEMFYWNGVKDAWNAKRINLCLYMRRLVIAMVGAPFLFVFRALDEKVWAQVTFVTSMVNLFAAEIGSLAFGISYLEALEITLGGTFGIGGFIGLVFGMYFLRDKLEERAKRKEAARWKAMQDGTYIPPAPKGPNPFKAFVHAKHQKICPEITWVEPKPVEAPKLPEPSSQSAPATTA